MNFDELLGKSITLLKEYHKEHFYDETPVIHYQTGPELLKKIDFNLNSKDEDLLKHIKNYLSYSVRTAHPGFSNQLWAGFDPIGVIGEIVTAFTNTTMATFEMSPVATLMEREIIKKMTSLVGFEDGEGIMLTGGSNANLMALHVARQFKFPEVKALGNNSRNLVAFVSEESHYSFSKAINLLGIGSENLIKIKAIKGKMDPSSLEHEILKAQHGNKTPYFVASTAGTTVRGAFDPIIQIDKVAKKYDLWHHVDGAWGGSVLLSQKHKHLIQGHELVDSFTWDAHKMMGATLIASAFLTKHKKSLYEANSGGGSRYIFHEYENTQYDLGPESIQCGRRNDALKLWLSWKVMGDEGFEKLIDSYFEQVQFAKKLVQEHPRLELIYEPEFLNLCYQVKPKNQDLDINKYNSELRYKVVKEGRYMVNFSREGDKIFFRDIFINNQKTQRTIQQYFDYLLSL